ncbi:radical SAM protein [Thermovibrio ammonificans]|uniref:Radical SAM domain protein n=1 Tax=Thermovibrio ammonificans (strain DSM 15698 / JCM 12110 / HB-1) TaxID=648996 RepID=E8T4Y9_THEA1|nr:radical SAM protein [Thermovibrio ammonificans]ADU97521.1 Radical SAM domain protein [Thermovibrio ammonificans HB-1]
MASSPFVKTDIPTSFKDHPGVLSALLYTPLRLCNLNCYHCHNKHLAPKEYERFNYGELEEKLSLCKLLGVELVIVSGGEPTLEPRLEEGLKFIKEKGFPVRLDTNGTEPERVEKLAQNRLIDGVALDVKIPLLDEYTPHQLKRFKRVLFSREDLEDSEVYNYVNRVKLTIEVLKRYSLPFTLLRTVEYPLLTDEDKELIRGSLKSFPHQFNPFYPVEAE